MAARKAKTATGAKPKAASKARAGTKIPAKAKVSSKAKAATKKPASKKPATKKPAAKKSAAKKAAAKKTAVKKASTKRAAAKRPLKAVDRVVAAARTVKAKPNDKIVTELAALAKYIRAAKRQISAIRPDDVKKEHLPKAADELDAVVEATADATNAIMDACDVVEGVMGDVTPEVSAKLMDATTAIYEACTFQDITGQRIGKVVTTMKHIEGRIDALMDAFGPKNTRIKAKTGSKSSAKAGAKKAARPKAEKKKQITDADLLEGPQLGENAKSQAEIDDLFASFD